MFNDRFGLTQAVLYGKKSQTRRIITPQPYYDENVGMVWKDYASGRGSSDFDEPQASYRNFVHHSRYKVGEIVAVAQCYSDIIERLQNPKMAYCAEHYESNLGKAMDLLRECEMGEHKGFGNKMFVKPELMPHQIKITNIRVNRLQDITYYECLSEGIQIAGEDDMNPLAYIYTFNGANQYFYHPREAYATLIDRIAGSGTWDSNPYVFVYDFELVK